MSRNESMMYRKAYTEWAQRQSDQTIFLSKSSYLKAVTILLLFNIDNKMIIVDLIYIIILAYYCCRHTVNK